MLEACFEAMLDLGRKLMRLLALCLDLPPGWYAVHTRSSASLTVSDLQMLWRHALSCVVAGPCHISWHP